MNSNLNRIERLKIWLINSLEPICDAEPNLLADYILALLEKQNSNVIDFKNLCESLEDFLGSETPTFVTRLVEYVKVVTVTSTSTLSPKSILLPSPTYQMGVKPFQSSNIPVELCKDYHC